MLFSVILNLLFGRERKGVKRIPALLFTQLKRSGFGRLIRWWSSRTERQKRLVFGIILCIALVITGHTLLGFSILLFDLLWELVLILARWMLRLWRLLLPIILRFLPNAVLNFVSTKLLPFFADIVPVIRDDHRVMYMRFNVQRHYRNLKAYLYRKSRSKRSEVRVGVRPFIGQQIRKKKSDLIEAAASHSDKDETGSNRSDDS